MRKSLFSCFSLSALLASFAFSLSFAASAFAPIKSDTKCFEFDEIPAAERSLEKHSMPASLAAIKLHDSKRFKTYRESVATDLASKREIRTVSIA